MAFFFLLKSKHTMIKSFTLFLTVALLSGCQVFRCQKTPCPKNNTCQPYVINGRRYVPQKHYELCQTGYASYYGGKDGMHGGTTCNGERFSMFAMTAAHKTLPVPSIIQVTNLENGRTVTLRVNDRGPFAKNRILDVSAMAARRLGFYHKGYAKVRVRSLVYKSQKCARKTRRVRRIRLENRKNALQSRYYISFQQRSLCHAKEWSKKIAEYGHVHIVPSFLGTCVLMGPYRLRQSAVEMIRYIPALKHGKIIQKSIKHSVNRHDK